MVPSCPTRRIRARLRGLHLRAYDLAHRLLWRPRRRAAMRRPRDEWRPRSARTMFRTVAAKRATSATMPLVVMFTAAVCSALRISSIMLVCMRPDGTPALGEAGIGGFATTTRDLYKLDGRLFSYMDMARDLDRYDEFPFYDDGLLQSRMLLRLLCIVGGAESGILTASVVRDDVPWWMSVAMADTLMVLVPVSVMTVAYMMLRFVCALVSGTGPSTRGVCGAAAWSFVSVLPGIVGLCVTGLVMGNGELYGGYSSLLDPCLMAGCPVYGLLLYLNENRSW